MTTEQTNASGVAVIVGSDEGYDRSSIDWGAREVSVDSVSDLEAGRASRFAERRAETIVVDGDDRVLSRVLTAFRRRHIGRERPLRFVPLRVGTFHRVADELEGPRPTDRLARQLEQHGGPPDHWSVRRQRALRLTTSAMAAPIWGFSAGAGIVYRLFEAWFRAEGSGLSGLGAAASRVARQLRAGDAAAVEPESSRLSVDYEPRSERLGYLVATALPRTWLGLAGADDDAASWTGGESGREFVTRVAGSAALPAFLTGGAGSTFDRLHVDGSAGFVVDGELYDPGEPHVLQVATGPRVRFATP